MKRFLTGIFCLAALLLLAACQQNDDTNLISGTYYAVNDTTVSFVGDFDPTPYLWFDTAEKKFAYGLDKEASYAETGSYTVKDGVIIATSNDNEYHIEIVDDKTLAMLGSEDAEHPTRTEFVLYEEPTQQQDNPKTGTPNGAPVLSFNRYV